MLDSYADVKENVRDKVKLEKYLVIDKLGFGKDAYKGYATKKEQKQRDVPLKLILSLANELGETVDGICDNKRIPNPNPYDIDKAFENISRAFKEAPNAWPSPDDEDAKKNPYWTVRNYKKAEATYIKNNLRSKLFWQLCKCWNKSADDIMRGNF